MRNPCVVFASFGLQWVAGYFNREEGNFMATHMKSAFSTVCIIGALLAPTSCVSPTDEAVTSHPWAGELGQQTQAEGTVPPSIMECVSDAPCNMKLISAGENHTVALKSDGSVWTWGMNSYGQLGDGTVSQRSSPVRVVGSGGAGWLQDVTEVAAGLDYTLALKSDKTVWAWGNGPGSDVTYGGLGDGTTSTRTSPVQVKGQGGYGFLTDVIAIASGHGHKVALKDNGTVWTWGRNSYGQLGDGTTTVPNYPVQVRGENGNGYLGDVIAIAAVGCVHTTVVKRDGTVWTWGYNEHGQLGDGTTIQRTTPVQVKDTNDSTGFLTRVIAVASGGDEDGHTLALKENGTVWAWGYNEHGQLGDGSTTNRSTAVQVRGVGGTGYLNGVIAISGGSHSDHSAALLADGTVVAWGINTDGQLGDGSMTRRTTPVRVVNAGGSAAFSDVVAIAGGRLHQVALKKDGTVWTWGNNDHGQLGNGSAGTSRFNPMASQHSWKANSTDVMLSCRGGVCVAEQGCLIGGIAYAPDAANPANECQVCNASVPNAWTNRPTGSQCSDDGLAWTLDVCDSSGTCTHVPSGMCEVDIGLVPPETVNPANECEWCNPSASATGWTAKNKGSACSPDGLSCTGDVCDGAGRCEYPVTAGCLIGGMCIPDRQSAPDNDCLECNAAFATDGYFPRPEGESCSNNGMCDGAGACWPRPTGQCRIAGVAYANGQLNPLNDCERCDSSIDPEGWVSRARGAACEGDGLSCTGSSCDGAGYCDNKVISGCLIGGVCVTAGTKNPSNTCEECNPARSSTRFVPSAQGSVCEDDGNPGTQDVCDGLGNCEHKVGRAHCVIGGNSLDAGSVNPVNGCQWCDPDADAAGWTNRQFGTICSSDHLACTNDICDGAGICQNYLYEGCLIGGRCIGTGGVSEDEECKECNPHYSTGNYSLKAPGEACSGDPNMLNTCDEVGECTHKERGECVIGGKTWAGGANNPDKECEWCAPNASSSSWSPKAAGRPCASDGMACTLDVCDGDGRCGHDEVIRGCAIDGQCMGAGAQSPYNPCLVCDPVRSMTEYVLSESEECRTGTECNDDSECKPGEICVNGECKPGTECNDDGECKPGETCVNGECKADLECEKDSECSADQICVEGECVGVECKEDSECSHGPCIDGRCKHMILEGGGCDCSVVGAAGGAGSASGFGGFAGLLALFVMGWARRQRGREDFEG